MFSMVKLQRRFAYKYKDKEHYKHIVTIPDEAREKLGWKVGEELEISVIDSKLIFSKKGRNRTKHD